MYSKWCAQTNEGRGVWRCYRAVTQNIHLTDRRQAQITIESSDISDAESFKWTLKERSNVAAEISSGIFCVIWTDEESEGTAIEKC